MLEIPVKGSQESQWSNALYDFVVGKKDIEVQHQLITSATISHHARFNETKLIFRLTGIIGE
jgi:hypothetical protein